MTISYSECSVSFHGDVPIFLGVQVEASDADAAYLSLGELHALPLRFSDGVRFTWRCGDVVSHDPAVGKCYTEAASEGRIVGKGDDLRQHVLLAELLAEGRGQRPEDEGRDEDGREVDPHRRRRPSLCAPLAPGAGAAARYERHTR